MYPETNILSWSLDGLFIDNSRFIQSGVVAVTFQFFKCFLLTPFLHTHTHTQMKNTSSTVYRRIWTAEAREDIAFFL